MHISKIENWMKILCILFVFSAIISWFFYLNLWLQERSIKLTVMAGKLTIFGFLCSAWIWLNIWRTIKLLNLLPCVIWYQIHEIHVLMAKKIQIYLSFSLTHFPCVLPNASTEFLLTVFCSPVPRLSLPSQKKCKAEGARRLCSKLC